MKNEKSCDIISSYKNFKRRKIMEKEIFLPLVLVIFAAVITLGYVFVLFRRVSRVAINDKKVEEIHNHIHEGAMTFLVREIGRAHV